MSDIDTAVADSQKALDQNRPIREADMAKAIAMSANDPSVWTGRALQAENDDLEVIGLAHLYPARDWNVCVPGHHGYPRASDLIHVSAPKARWVT